MNNEFLEFFALMTSENGPIVKQLSITDNIKQELLNDFDNQFKIMTQTRNQELKQEIDFVEDGKQYTIDKLEELLFIKDFEDGIILQESIQNIETLEILDIKEDIHDIKAIFTCKKYPEHIDILIQAFNKRRIVSKKRAFIWDKNTMNKLQDDVITFASQLSGYIRCTSNDLILKFVSLHEIKQIFDITKYIEDATDDDLTTFTQNPLFNCDFEIKNIATQPMRKKIALILKGGVLNSSFDSLNSAIISLNIPIATDTTNKKITLSAERKKLNIVLDFLNENIYKSPLLDIIYATNSKKKYEKDN